MEVCGQGLQIRSKHLDVGIAPASSTGPFYRVALTMDIMSLVVLFPRRGAFLARSDHLVGIDHSLLALSFDNCA